ncbi:facilitated trehalose transporter Tret1-like isoform X1 [Galleria mellonella]|uniref:Facilitated trehalose transporter Tret1-like isoform X1 n=1 Tax=Galleria mellonella TaxID=7137 RepID=A0ABM3MP00_GALME|nr:facilitated trehalose transporter Tret1-like isoform X1 [Galleria mellonella]
MVSPVFRQIWTVSAVLLNMIGQGMVLSYPSSLLPGLQSENSTIKVDFNTAAWLSSSIGLAGIPGFLLSSYFMDIWGRKVAHGLIIIPGTIGWSLVYAANNIPTLMIARILGGMTAGGTVGLGAVVIGEYTDPKHRGMFLNLKTAAVCMGGMLVHALGHFVDWRTIALVALVPHILALGIICSWPESPSWLALKKQFEKSEQSFYWLRGKTTQSRKEIEELIRAQKESLQLSSKKISLGGRIKEFFRKFLRKDFTKPLVIVILGTFLLEASGRHIFPAYAIKIINAVTGDSSQSFYYTLAIDIIITTSAVFSSILVKMFKRRTLLFVSGFSAVAVLMSVCLYLFLVSRDLISSERTWIPIMMFVAYFILANLGCTPIPLALIGEVFPLAHRGIGSCCGGLSLSIVLNIGLQVAPYLMASVKVYGTFAILGATTGIVLMILFFILPETKDKTLQEIDDYFKYGKFKDVRENNDDDEVNVKMIT